MWYLNDLLTYSNINIFIVRLIINFNFDFSQSTEYDLRPVSYGKNYGSFVLTRFSCMFYVFISMLKYKIVGSTVAWRWTMYVRTEK